MNWRLKWRRLAELGRLLESQMGSFCERCKSAGMFELGSKNGFVLHFCLRGAPAQHRYSCDRQNDTEQAFVSYSTNKAFRWCVPSAVLIKLRENRELQA